MPSRGGNAHVVSANQAEESLSKDSQTFKNLRQAGFNPKGINGAHELEKRAESALEIAMGKTAVQLASDTPSARRGDAGARRDIAKGAPEYRKRAVEAQSALDKGDLAFSNDGTGRKKGLPA
jgi:hypothetical protein